MPIFLAPDFNGPVASDGHQILVDTSILRQILRDFHSSLLVHITFCGGRKEVTFQASCLRVGIRQQFQLLVNELFPLFKRIYRKTLVQSFRNDASAAQFKSEFCRHDDSRFAIY